MSSSDILHFGKRDFSDDIGSDVTDEIDFFRFLPELRLPLLCNLLLSLLFDNLFIALLLVDGNGIGIGGKDDDGIPVGPYIP